MHKQQSRGSVGRRTTHRRVSDGAPLDFTAERDRREACNRPFLMIADGLPCGRPHPAFDNVASAARIAEGRGDPSSYIMRPMLACVDAAVALHQVPVLRALFLRIDTFFAACRAQLEARVPSDMRDQVFGAAPGLLDAFATQTKEDAEADIAASAVLANPNDLRAIEIAEQEVSEEIAAKQVWHRALCILRFKKGGTAHGVLLTR